MIKIEKNSSKVSAKKRGFTLTEIAIVLGIIGLILGAIWVAAAAVYSNQRINHANTAILQIVQGARSLFQGATSVGSAGDLTPAMIKAGVIPSDLVNGSAATGPWPGSTVSVLAKAAADTSFTVEMNNIPQQACIGLIQNVAGSATRDAGLYSVGAKTASGTVNATATAGTALTPGNAQIAATKAADAANACSASDNTNIVQFNFTIQ